MKWPLLAGVLLAYAVSTWPPGGQQVFRSGIQTVLVDVSVMRGHTPVVDLSATDFSLTDNSVQQHVETVAAATIPLDISLVVDATHAGVLYGMGANASNWADVQRSVRQMAAALRADDRLRVLGFAADVVETRPMSPIGSNVESIAVATTGTFTNRYAITQALLTALTVPVAPDRRHVVILFALGSGRPTVALLEHLVPAARRADALLFAVLPPAHREEVTHRPFPFFPSETVIRDAVTQAAEATGGKTYLTGDIVGAFRDVLKEFRSSYMLRYTLEGVPPAGWHDIAVKIPSCPTCTVSARRGYMGR
jgi:VWFA-related protein